MVNPIDVPAALGGKKILAASQRWFYLREVLWFHAGNPVFRGREERFIFETDNAVAKAVMPP